MWPPNGGRQDDAGSECAGEAGWGNPLRWVNTAPPAPNPKSSLAGGRRRGTFVTVWLFMGGEGRVPLVWRAACNSKFGSEKE